MVGIVVVVALTDTGNKYIVRQSMTLTSLNCYICCCRDSGQVHWFKNPHYNEE